MGREAKFGMHPRSATTHMKRVKPRALESSSLMDVWSRVQQFRVEPTRNGTLDSRLSMKSVIGWVSALFRNHLYFDF